MARWIGVALFLLLIVAGIGAWRALKVDTEKLDDRLYALMGGGGNTLMLVGDEGALVVDTKFSWPAAHLQKEVKRITGKPVKMVIDTHYHFDHTHGNPYYPGAEFVAHPRTRAHLLELDGGMFGPGAEGAAMVPTTLVDTGKQFEFADDYVDVRYLGRGHTDGDVVVFLHKRSILHTGDLFLNGLYPVIDLKGGGSVRELGPTLDKVIAIGARRIIPGHGPIAGPEDLKLFRKYIRALWDHALAAAHAGKCDESTASFDAVPFHLSPLPGFSSLRKNIDAACEEATALVASERAPAR